MNASFKALDIIPRWVNPRSFDNVFRCFEQAKINSIKSKNIFAVCYSAKCTVGFCVHPKKNAKNKI